MKDATKYIRAKIITALNGNVSYSGSNVQRTEPIT